ncbi:MAG TPA: TRAP transporter fused permease subunit, partial [Pararhodobacter sp.]|uniref:TRAP transporter permease n=1 Tax=Pararhodobacter sp. TaxID=2127056 RepID=UPI002B603C02
ILSYSPAEIATATGAILTLIELTRRAFGPILALVGAVVLAYALWGGGLPGFFSHSGFDLETLVGPIWYGFQGVFGFATSTIISVVFIYIVFGAMLEGSGAGELMIRVALWATGRSRGGAGHAAILASSVFGMSSGSVVANVVGTGTVTIPLIKRRGFSPAFAGALEAAASSGGQIMPPVLGAAAFLMAQLVGLSYQSIVIASTLPALLFYFALFVSVEKEARRLGIEPLADAERPRLQPGDGLRSLMFVAPIAAILVTLALGRSTAMAGFWAVITTLVTALILNPALRQQPGKLLVALARGGYAGAQVMVAVGSIGILVGVFDLTGLGLRFAMAVSSLQTSGLLVPLLLSAAACLVLGMGMSTLPAYLIETLLRGRAICPGNASPPPGGADRNFIFI